MVRICLLVHALTPPSGQPTGSVADRAWDLARRLVAAGEQVALIHTDVHGAAAGPALAAAAERAGIRFIGLWQADPPFDVPLFPASAIHTAAHQVAAILRDLSPDACVVLDEPALAAIAIGQRRTGAGFEHTRFVLSVEALQREVTMLAQDQFPAGGRDEAVHNYLERAALAGADDVITSTRRLAAALSAGGAAAPRVLEWPTGDALPGAWRALLSRGPELAARQPAPRISVCVPYYDQPVYFDEALASLAAQTQPPFEVIVLDDGTPSAAGKAAFAAAEKKYAPLGWRFLRQANAGAAAARNRLVEVATGDAVLFCDHDNRFHPEMIAALGRAYALSGADCVTCGFRAFLAEPDPADPGYVFSPLGECVELGLVENVLGDNNFLVRRSSFVAQAGFTTDRAANEDWQFLLQLLRRGGHVAAIPTILFEYRRIPGSKVRKQGEFASAVATLAPILAETEPAWRRMWPQLVATIRNPQVPQLEHELEARRLRHQAELAEAQQQAAAAALEVTHTKAEAQQALAAAQAEAQRQLAAAQQQVDAIALELAKTKSALRRSRWKSQYDKAVLDETQAAKAAVASARDREAGRAADLEQQLAKLREEHAKAVAERDAKIRRMQVSWSWQATAPARALRRKLIDPMRRSGAMTPAVAVVPRPVRFALDRPAFLESAPAAGVIDGWCLFDHDQPARAVRVLVNGEELAGVTNRVREDVAKAHGLSGAAAPCGFEARYKLPVDADHQLRIEAQSADGEWHLLREGVLHTTSQPRDVHDYTAWVETYGTVTPEKAAALRDRLAKLTPGQRPLISVIVPVYNPAQQWLERAIESVRAQVYENWELCIADDLSTAGHVFELLDRYQKTDPRIRVRFRPVNGHISAASNTALELARGDFVALLDHDDELSPDALAEVVLLLAERPDTDLVYSDEDKMDEEGRRRTPYFKPDYLPDLLLGQNCLSHLSVYRTSLVRAVGGFRLGYEGSQDWDLALRVVDQTTPARIQHIPKVLYHWRAINGSTAVTVSAKNYSVDAARRALLDHFQRRGIQAEVRPVPGDHWQIVYPLPDPVPLVSIIIPTHNAAGLLRKAIGSIIARSEYPHFEILVVNNRSDDPDTLELFQTLAAEENVRVIDYDAPFNFSAINNAAVRQAKGSVLCFLNNDIEVVTGRWLDEMVSHALRPEIGAVGAMLYYPNATIQHAGVILGLGGVANHAFLHFPHGTDGYMNRARLAQNYSAVTAACLVVRRAVFEQVGGFNETDLAVAFNDIDLCLRIRAAGYRNLWTPFAELYHHESASRGDDNAPDKQPRFVREIEYMRRTWGPLLDRDPAYNPNLALNLLGWQLAWPPRV